MTTTKGEQTQELKNICEDIVYILNNYDVDNTEKELNGFITQANIIFLDLKKVN